MPPSETVVINMAFTIILITLSISTDFQSFSKNIMLDQVDFIIIRSNIYCSIEY